MIFVSVVSHGHFDLIKDLGVLADISKDSRFSIFLVDNVGEATSSLGVKRIIFSIQKIRKN